MSTIASVERDGTTNLFLLTKGAPETVLQFLDSSKVPSDYEQHYKAYTRQGYRVIALAFKPLSGNIEKVFFKKIHEFFSFILF